MAAPSGRLELIYGCMFSGKTTELIRRLGAARQTGAEVVAIKPRRDTRYARDRIVTHVGDSFDATVIDQPEEVVSAAGGREVVGIDEAHFFDSRLADACRQLVELGRRVIVAMVDLDHRGRPFPAFPPLLALADEATRRTARCARCGQVAEFSQRLIDSDEPIVVGASESYEARCPSCFRPPP